jgi:lipopolysaccharide/colanic/teichoic acid biosynthesis glycosyltransferase
MSTLKRAFDLFWATVGVLLLWPVFVIVVLAITLDDGGPVFFRQERVGWRGRPFRMWKFRTMIRDAARFGRITVENDARITRVGRVLRRTKLDELPQLLNVLAGEMSLVGPRPPLPSWVAVYTPEQRRVLDLVPGITDPASLHHWGECALHGIADPERYYFERLLPEKIDLSLAYAKRATLFTDTLLILRTLSVLSRDAGSAARRTPLLRRRHTVPGGMA